MPAVSKAQQRFFGMVRAAQKGEMENPSSEVAQAASSMSKSDVKKFAKTKHDKLPEKKEVKERADFWDPDPDKDRKLGGPGANQRAREDRVSASRPKPKADPKKLRKGESYMDYAKRQRGTSAAPKRKERKRDRVGRALGKLVDRAAGIKNEALSPSILGSSKAMKKISDNERKNREQDARMKYGKRWKEFTSDAAAAKDRLRKGEVRKFNKTTGKWESNKD